MGTESKNMFVRVIPHGPGTHRCKRYSIDGARFELGRGWYPVTPRMADILRDIRSGNHETSPKIFEVATQYRLMAKLMD